MINLPAVKPAPMAVSNVRLSMQFSPTGDLRINAPANGFADAHFWVAPERLKPTGRIYIRSSGVVGILGRPIVDERMSDDAVISLIDKHRSLDRCAAELNGSFLVFRYDSMAPSLQIISDRFSSQKFYYRQEGEILYGAGNLSSLLDMVRASGRTCIDQRAVFELLYFRRLFGTKTLDTSAHLLEPAAILKVEKSGKPNINVYWRPDLNLSADSVDKQSQQLAAALRRTMTTHMSDGHKYGIFLSGGLDSRALLAAAPKVMECFTTCLEQNNESEVAEICAGMVGSSHVFIPHAAGRIGGALDALIQLTSGEHSVCNTQFYGYGEIISPTADVLFLGLGLDVFFSGLYQPKQIQTLFGKRSHRFRLGRLNSNIRDQFIESVKYRLRSSDPFALTRPEYRKRARDWLRDTVDSELARAGELTDNPYQEWEFLHTRPLSRHYSFSMAQSISGYAECRIPALDNELFNLFFSIPPSLKANWTVYRKALSILNQDLLKVRNANTNVRADLPLAMQTLVTWSRAFANRTLGTQFLLPPNSRDRSWLGTDEHVSENAQLAAAVAQLPEEALNLTFLDPDMLRKMCSDAVRMRANAEVLVHLVGVVRHFERIST